MDERFQGFILLAWSVLVASERLCKLRVIMQYVKFRLRRVLRILPSQDIVFAIVVQVNGSGPLALCILVTLIQIYLDKL